MFVRISLLAFASLPLAACLTPREVADPNTITLTQAVNEVASSLHNVRDRYRNEPRIGMYPSEATVTFNISSGSTETTGLQLGAAAPATVSPIPITFNASEQIVATGNRGNQITIKFVNILDHPPTLGRPTVKPKVEKPPAKPGQNIGQTPTPAPAAAPAPGQQSGVPDWYKCFVGPPFPSYCNAIPMMQRIPPEEFKKMAPAQQKQLLESIPNP